MQIRQLQHFEAVHRLRSFARAAEEHFITQSALSRSIKSLEAELGQRLFDRTTHAVEPTDAANCLLHHALDAIGALRAFEEEAARLRGGTTGHVRIGSGPYPAQPLITRVIRGLSDAHDGVQVSVVAGSSDNLLSALVQRDLDFVVCDVSKYEDTPFADDITVIPLPREPVVVVLAEGHPALRSSISFEVLASFPWALPTPAPLAARKLAEPFAQAFAAGRFPFYRLETTAACLEVVKDARTLTMVPLSLARDVCPANGLIFRAGTGQHTNDGIHLLRHRTRSPAVQLAIDAVRSQAAAIERDSASWSE